MHNHTNIIHHHTLSFMIIDHHISSYTIIRATAPYISWGLPCPLSLWHCNAARVCSRKQVFTWIKQVFTWTKQVFTWIKQVFTCFIINITVIIICIIIIIIVTKTIVETFQAPLQPLCLPSGRCLPNQHHQAVFMMKVIWKQKWNWNWKWLKWFSMVNYQTVYVESESYIKWKQKCYHKNTTREWKLFWK